jgi:hypothetical protein
MELLLLLANAAAGIATALDAYNQNGWFFWDILLKDLKNA